MPEYGNMFVLDSGGDRNGSMTGQDSFSITSTSTARQSGLSTSTKNTRKNTVQQIGNIVPARKIVLVLVLGRAYHRRNSARPWSGRLILEFLSPHSGLCVAGYQGPWATPMATTCRPVRD